MLQKTWLSHGIGNTIESFLVGSLGIRIYITSYTLMRLPWDWKAVSTPYEGLHSLHSFPVRSPFFKCLATFLETLLIFTVKRLSFLPYQNSSVKNHEQWCQLSRHFDVVNACKLGPVISLRLIICMQFFFIEIWILQFFVVKVRLTMTQSEYMNLYELKRNGILKFSYVRLFCYFLFRWSFFCTHFDGWNIRSGCMAIELLSERVRA